MLRGGGSYTQHASAGASFGVPAPLRKCPPTIIDSIEVRDHSGLLRGARNGVLAGVEIPKVTR